MAVPAARVACCWAIMTQASKGATSASHRCMCGPAVKFVVAQNAAALQVTVLAVFEKLHADEDLYALVFGESVLNDAGGDGAPLKCSLALCGGPADGGRPWLRCCESRGGAHMALLVVVLLLMTLLVLSLGPAVAIVLYRVLAGFLHERVTAGAITKALGAFLLIFLGSMAIGLKGVCGKANSRAPQRLPAPVCTHILRIQLAACVQITGYACARARFAWVPTHKLNGICRPICRRRHRLYCLVHHQAACLPQRSRSRGDLPGGSAGLQRVLGGRCAEPVGDCGGVVLRHGGWAGRLRASGWMGCALGCSCAQAAAPPQLPGRVLSEGCATGACRGGCAVALHIHRPASAFCR